MTSSRQELLSRFRFFNYSRRNINTRIYNDHRRGFLCIYAFNSKNLLKNAKNFIKYSIFVKYSYLIPVLLNFPENAWKSAVLVIVIDSKSQRRRARAGDTDRSLEKRQKGGCAPEICIAPGDYRLKMTKSWNTQWTYFLSRYGVHVHVSFFFLFFFYYQFVRFLYKEKWPV